MKKIFILLLIAVLALVACDNYISRNLGGSTTIHLKPGERLVEVTWKENSIWYLTEPMDSDYIPKTKIFREDSNLGIAEGDVTFIETR